MADRIDNLAKLRVPPENFQLPPRTYDDTAKRRAEKKQDFQKFLQVAGQLTQTAARIGLNVAAPGLGAGPLGAGLTGQSGLTGSDNYFAQQMLLFELQRKVQHEQQVFTTMTNISKAYHDGRMSAVRNLRS